MSITNILSTIICQTFEKEVGKGQRTANGPGKALRIKFNTKTNYDVEEGYRYLTLVIYAPGNYVQVWVQESWNVIPLEDLEDDGLGNTYVKKGKNYNEGSRSWQLVTNHDSCWRNGVEQIFRNEYGQIDHVDNAFNHWYEVVNCPDEILDLKAVKP